jgi:predicted DNA-binding protein (UPF0251 family)
MTPKKTNLAPASKRTHASPHPPAPACMPAMSSQVDLLLQLAQHVQISPSEALRLVDPDGVNQVAPDLEKATSAVAVYRAQVAAKTLAALERMTKPLSENS